MRKNKSKLLQHKFQKKKKKIKHTANKDGGGESQGVLITYHF